MTWQRVRLQDLGDWYGGGTPSKSRPDYWTGGSIPWLSPKDMGPEVLDSTEDTVTASAVTGSSVRLVPSNAVAVVVRSGILERKLPVALVPFETTLNQDMKAVVPRLGIDSRWIAWGLRAFEQDLLRETRKAGTTVASIEMPRFYDFELAVPPLDEQTRILGLLEDYLSRMDAADREARRADARLTRLRQAVWSSAFSTLDAPTCPLLEVAEIANGQTPKGLADKVVGTPLPDTVPFYKVGDMNAANGRWMSTARSYVSTAVADEFRLHVRPAGTVLIPKRGGAIATNKKRILATPAAFDLNTMGLVTSDRLDSTFLWHWLQGVDLGKLADGSSVPQINAPQMRTLSLPVPRLQDQTSLVARLDEASSNIVRVERATAHALKRSAALRQSLFAAAFSGRLTNSLSLEEPE